MSDDDIRVTPWDGADPPTEAALLRRYAAEGMSPCTWSNGPGDVYAPHSHGYRFVTVSELLALN